MRVFIFVSFFAQFFVVFGRPDENSDPCAGTCGINASCEKVSNIIVCVCPNGMVGEPFVECKFPPMNSTSQAPEPIPVHPPAIHQVESVTPFIPIVSTTVTFPTTSQFPVTTHAPPHPNLQTKRDEELLSHIASAPPTLSHYAHSHATPPQHPLSPPIFLQEGQRAPAASQQLFSDGSRTRTRPQPQHEHDHQDRNHDQPHHHQTNYPHSSHFDLSQQPQQQQQNYKTQSTGPSSSQNAYYKDPLGKYDDCRMTPNNIVICADKSAPGNFQTGQDSRLNSYEPLPFIPDHQIKSERMRIPTMRPSYPNYYDEHSMEISSRLEGPYGHPPLHLRERLIYPQLHVNAPKPTGSGESKVCDQYCGIDSVCRVLLGRPICGCAEGHTGDPSVQCMPILNSKFDRNSCEVNRECDKTQVCKNGQCQDPCTAENETENICGINAKCNVIHHTLLCSCEPGMSGNPYVECVKIMSL